MDLAFDSSGNLYVACNSGTLGDSRILKFNQDGVGSVFASGLANAVGIAIEEIPEPSALLLLGLGLSVLAFSHRAALPYPRSRHRRRRTTSRPKSV